MEPAARSASAQDAGALDDTFGDADDSFQAEHDSFATSQQCSADPNAFRGFHVPPSAENFTLETCEVTQIKKKQKTLKLVLDLDARDESKTRGADFQLLVSSQSQSSDSQVEMRNQFSELFAKDTQDEETAEMQRRTEQSSPLKRKREQEMKRARSPSPPPSLLTKMDKAWRAKKQEKKSGANGESSHAIGGSEYSEDLAPHIFKEIFTPPVSSLNAEKKTTTIGETEVVLSDKESDRETDYDDELECTQALDDYEPEEENDGKENPVSYSAVSEGVAHDADAHPYSMSDTGTQPPGEDSTFQVDDDDSARDDADITRLDESDFDQASADRIDGDDAISRDESQIKVSDNNIEYLTPRATIQRVETDAGDGETNGVGVEQIDDDRDECMPTQRSEDQIRNEPSAEPHSPSDQNGDEGASSSKQTSGTDSQAKAIRTLEFSFASTGSQDNDQAEASAESLPSKTLSRLDKSSPFESSMSPVCPSIPTPVDGLEALRRKTVSTKQGELSVSRPTGKKEKSPPPSAEQHAQLNATPNTKRRKCGIFSPDRGLSSTESSPMTPQQPLRRSTRSTQSTPSSTPTIRTRAKILSPLPTNRVYASRAQTIFKYKFEFCLTGFVNEGEETLKELISEHGGKIPERYQDVLYKNNAKAVVIGTPVSWRKRKFMQAVACGIPVVHPEWIHACVKAGQVVPFDGYHVPSGYSVTTHKFECLPSRKLRIFEGYSFGIVCKPEAKERADLMAFILKACGADAVEENLSAKECTEVDVVLCDEYTKTCQYYKKRDIPIKDFQWVTECMILQRFVDPTEPVCEPQRHGRESVSAASAEIGDKDKTTLKLYTGELVLADISGYEIDHFLLFNVCEILSIHVANHKEEGSQPKKKEESSRITLNVGVLKRVPNSAGLSKMHTKVLEIPASQVKRRVVSVSKEDFESLAYRDESIFYFENEKKDQDNDHDPAQRRWLTQ